MSEQKCILIVDDEKDMVDMLSLRLEAAGFRVCAAYDGQEGLGMVRKEKPDLILLDVMMPKLDGYQVCRMLKFDQKFRDIPIIMLTARSQEQDKATGGDVGADAYVTKPFESADLVAKIEKMLNKE